MLVVLNFGELMANSFKRFNLICYEFIIIQQNLKMKHKKLCFLMRYSYVDKSQLF